jgi:hypothetical protein
VVGKQQHASKVALFYLFGEAGKLFGVRVALALVVPLANELGGGQAAVRGWNHEWDAEEHEGNAVLKK